MHILSANKSSAHHGMTEHCARRGTEYAAHRVKCCMICPVREPIDSAIARAEEVFATSCRK